jgi:hypothetical protein
MHHLTRRGAIAALALSVAAATASAAIFNETEPNDTKATANIVAGITAGDSIVGNSTSSSGVGIDYFDVRVATAPLGIYRHRLVITTQGTAGHTGSIRGLTQVAAPPDTLPGIPWDGVIGAPGTTESALQTSVTTPARFNQWYGFGKGERFHYRVNGGTATTADYVATMETVPVTPTNLGVFASGLITISTFGQGHSTDTDFWVYDENLNPIPGYGNDDESPLGGSPGTGATLQGWLARSYGVGTYYLALSNFNVATNQPSPSDDDFRTGSLMEFPGVAVNTSSTVNLNLSFTIADSAGNVVSVADGKLGAFDINWYVFTVPEPGSLSLLALGALAMGRRRR